jgi:putative ABC transport system substrate-binding protein
MSYGAVGLLVTLILSTFTWSGAAEAQPATRVWRIGYLVPTELPRSTLIDPLRDLGYIDGQTARFEIRTAQNNLERLPSLAAELVRAQVDIIVAGGPPAIIAARQATSTIPIVMAFWGGEGLLESGVVASFARPGGNVTGVYMLAAELDAKRCELLLQAVPQARTVGVLNPGRGWSLKHLQDFAETHKIALRLSDVPGPGGYDATFAALRQARVDALLVPSSVRFFREQLMIIEAAAKHRIPAIYEWGDMARAGGLMGYGPVRADIHQRVAQYVHKILQGAQPAGMPVEQPTRFELVVNLKAAQTLGLTPPPALLLQANEVIR